MSHCYFNLKVKLKNKAAHQIICLQPSTLSHGKETSPGITADCKAHSRNSGVSSRAVKGSFRDLSKERRHRGKEHETWLRHPTSLFRRLPSPQPSWPLPRTAHPPRLDLRLSPHGRPTAQSIFSCPCGLPSAFSRLQASFFGEARPGQAVIPNLLPSEQGLAGSSLQHLRAMARWKALSGRGLGA